MRSTSSSTRAIVGELCSARRISTMPWTISSSWFSPAMPSRGCEPTVTSATSLTSTGVPFGAAIMVLASASIERIRPTPRTTAACWPILTVLPPTLMLELEIACSSCGRVSPFATSLLKSTCNS